MKATLDSVGKKDFEGESENEAERKERQHKRLYSFKDLFNLVTAITNQSDVHHRLVAAESNIEVMQKEI